MSTIGRRTTILRGALVGNLRAHQFWRHRPNNRFTRDGFEVIPRFFDADECARLVRVADTLLTDRSEVIAGNCFTWVKSDAAHGRNTRVREILNVNEVDDGVAELQASQRIQRLYEDRLHEAIELYGFSVQVDGVDTRTKRGFHIDNTYPPLFKAFVYLTDVRDEADGPYTIIPGSHRRFSRKAMNDLRNALTTAAARDMSTFPGRVERVFAPAGTLILSTQDAVHKGGSEQRRGPRYALVAHGTSAKHHRGEVLSDGRPAVLTNAS